MRIGIRHLALYAICAALLVAVQLALSFIANVELVTLLIILFAKRLGARVLYPIYVFVLVEGLIFGFHMWIIAYLYVWPLLALVAAFALKSEKPLVLAIAGGFFGLIFGTLCAIPYFVTLGASGGLSYIVAGIPFDLIHCAANFLSILLLYKPLARGFDAACPAELTRAAAR